MRSSILVAVMSLVTPGDGFGSIISTTSLSTFSNRYAGKTSAFAGLRFSNIQRAESSNFKYNKFNSNIYSSSVADEKDILASTSNNSNRNNDEKAQFFPLTASEKSSAELLFNFALLSAAFGFAIFTILNIDHGMTRGWTHAEIITRVPFDNWRQYEDSLSEKPIFTKTTINVIIYLLGDWLSQTVFQEKDVLDFDASRTLRNGFIGLCFGPLVHQYYEFSDSILPPAIPVNRIYKILMDQTLYLGVKCSAYIAAVGFLGGQSKEEVADNVKTRIQPIMVKAWKFWPLVHCVTYGVIPARHRILWVNSVDLIWNAILAQAVSNDDEHEDEINTAIDVADVNIDLHSLTTIELKMKQTENGIIDMDEVKVAHFPNENIYFFADLVQQEHFDESPPTPEPQLKTVSFEKEKSRILI